MFTSSQGHLFRTREEKQSPGRVYGYFPPNCQSWLSIPGEKVWRPPPSPGKRTPQGGFLSSTVVTLLHFTGDGETGYLPV